MTPKPRRISTCHRHPAEPITGFCALCLRDRLSVLDSPSSSSAAAASSSFQPELRRCKSQAAGKRGASSSTTALEPRRKSCDDRTRKNNSLWNLFNLDDKENDVNRGPDVESKNLGLDRVGHSVIECGGNVRVSEGENVNDNDGKDEEAAEEETKTMKEHIELEWKSVKHNRKDLKDIAGNILLAASDLGKKLRKWRVQQPTKKQTNGVVGDLLPVEKANVWKRKEKQSDGGDYVYRRRSCDTEPRFSLDANRIALDDHPRFSLDEPRASWDGYMIARTIPRLAPMLSVIENAIVNENETTSGGSGQTRDYGSDSSSSLHRQNSFDCSSSGKSSFKKTVAVAVDEMKSIKFVVTDRDSGGDEDRERFESACQIADPVVSCGDPNGFKKSGKWRKGWSILGFMHRRHEEKCGKVEGDGNGYMVGDCGEKQNGEANGVVINGDSSKGEANEGVINSDCNGRLVRSGSVSYRSSHKVVYHRSLSVAETRDYGKKSREESGSERNRSATMYSPSNSENGLLRFHLTPSWSHRKKPGRSRLRNSDSITRNIFRLN